MKIKTFELQGAALSWAVAVAQGDKPVFQWRRHSKGAAIYRGEGFRMNGLDFRPLDSWAQGGPIIERMFREGLEMRQGEPEAGNQRAWARLRDGRYYWHETSPLIAAMRCYVASKLGDEVDVPEELL